jgi:signal transduction histidine kinase
MNGRTGAGVWWVLAGCAALIVAAMGWLTHSVMRAERERSLAESRARLEEKIRLSLWRMDSLAATVTIEENQRVLLPRTESATNPLARIRFRSAPKGGVQPTGPATEEDLGRLNEVLAEGGAAEAFGRMCSALQGDNLWQANLDYGLKAVDPAARQREDGPVQQADQQQALNWNERAFRGNAVNNAVSKAGLTQQMAAPNPVDEALGVSNGGFQPTWLGGEAFLLRRDLNGAAIEGVWLDRDKFRRMLLDEVADLLPVADLVPSRPGEDDDPMNLASFPWRLVPGEKAAASPVLRGPVVASLSVGWLAVLVALLAGLALVRGIVRLSERRASFVSAVTHELRTPLTTFRLYSDLLASGAVADESKRDGYFRTMRREADRLSHLVENVLAFSRIERKGGGTRPSRLEVGALLESMRERFEERLAGAGLKLEVAVVGEPVARADAAAVEHVLFNLIDNAGKYAAGGDPPRVAITAGASGDRVEIEVADHGPGIPESERRRIFRAFHKSAAEAADSAPGVGLGLALSRRIARDMGGALEYRGGGGGARFLLVLPAGC